MKPKLLLCLAAVILLNPAYRVLGSMVILSVDSTNIQTLPFVVKTEEADYGRKILFRVIADPKGAPYAPEDNMHFSLGRASLSVYDGTNCISSCSVAGQKVPSNMRDVKPPLADKGVLFEFTVGTNYLRSVEFEIGYGSTLHPAIDNYRFALQTFVPAADTGLSFGIYLTAEAMDRRITGYGQGDWSHIRLLESPLISATDIISYNFMEHSMRLRPEALAKIPRPPVEGTPFIVVANGQRIYFGVFVTCISSMSFAVPTIVVDRQALVTNQPPDTLVIQRAYPQPSFGIGPDPRGDQRVKTVLNTLHKLKNEHP